MADFDSLLDDVGSRGKFQKIIIYGILFPCIALEPLYCLNMIFLWAEPPHWCHVPGRELTNLTNNQWKNITLPWEKGPDGSYRFSRCERFEVNITSLINLNEEDNINKFIPMDNQPKVTCTDGWESDQTDYGSTAATDNGWFCDKNTYVTNLFTASAVGSAAGTVIFGQLADIYGRRPIFFVVSAMLVIFRLLTLITSHIYILQVILVFLAAMPFPINYNLLCMICGETVDKKFRTRSYGYAWMIWVVGMCLLALLGWLIRDWVILGFVTTLPGLIVAAYWKILPESARWLISVGKVDQAAELLRKIAKTNGKPEPDNLLPRLQEMTSRKEKKHGVFSLLSRRRIALRTILLTVCWSANATLYNCIHLNLNNMSGDPYFNLFLLAIIEIPSTFAGMYLFDRLGRRWTNAIFLGFTSVCYLVLTFLATEPSLELVEVGIILILKFNITLSFLGVYLQGTELYPTCLRSTGIALSSTAGSIVGTFAPYIIYLGTFKASLPYVVLMVIAVLATIASMLLPETLNMALPETLEDAHNFGSLDFWSWRVPPPSVKDSKIVQEELQQMNKRQYFNSNNNANIVIVKEKN